MEEQMATAAAGPLALARHYLQMRQYERALDAVRDVTSAELDDPSVWFVRAAALHGLRRFTDAVDAAQRGLNLAPDDITLLDQLALSAFEAGEQAVADRALDRALELAPDRALLLAHRALFLARQKGGRLKRRKRLEEATHFADRAAALAPESTAVLRIRTAVAALAGDPRAEELKRQLLAADPADKNARIVSGTVAVRSRNIDEGLEHYVAAAKLDPGDRRAAWMGRRSRTLMHPAVRPLRIVWRLGPRRVQLAVIALSIVLLAIHANGAREIVLGLWVLLVVYSFVVRAVLRARYGKRPD
jgi:tetratricopeptide (TPR) repeat protein